MLLLLLSSVCLLPGLAGTDGQIKKGVFSWNYFFFPGKKGSEKRLLTKEFHPNNFRIRVYIYIDIL